MMIVTNEIVRLVNDILLEIIDSDVYNFFFIIASVNIFLEMLSSHESVLQRTHRAAFNYNFIDNCDSRVTSSLAAGSL